MSSPRDTSYSQMKRLGVHASVSSERKLFNCERREYDLLYKAQENLFYKFLEELKIKESKKTPQCFISYVIKDETSKSKATELRKHLEKSGCIAILADEGLGRREPSSFITNEIAKSNFVLLIGTKKYLSEYNRLISSRTSADAIQYVMMFPAVTEYEKSMPLLFEGVKEECFPMVSTIKRPFKFEKNYFEELVNLIISVKGISQDSAFTNSLDKYKRLLMTLKANLTKEQSDAYFNQAKEKQDFEQKRKKREDDKWASDFLVNFLIKSEYADPKEAEEFIKKTDKSIAKDREEKKSQENEATWMVEQIAQIEAMEKSVKSQKNEVREAKLTPSVPKRDDASSDELRPPSYNPPSYEEAVRDRGGPSL